MKSEFLRFMIFAIVVVTISFGVFRSFDIDYQEWMDFKWSFLLPLAALGAIFCFIAAWWSKRK